MKKCIVTVLGKDTVGIVAKVCTYLAENKINVLDISQTIMQELFTMVMLVDLSGTDAAFESITAKLEALEKELGVSIRIQHEDLFQSMHRI